MAEEDLAPGKSSVAVNNCIRQLSYCKNDIRDTVGIWGEVSHPWKGSSSCMPSICAQSPSFSPPQAWQMLITQDILFVSLSVKPPCFSTQEMWMMLCKQLLQRTRERPV